LHIEFPVQQVFIGGTFIGGSEELISLINEGKIQQVLKANMDRPGLPDSLKGIESRVWLFRQLRVWQSYDG
jgi:hypothetical protein